MGAVPPLISSPQADYLNLLGPQYPICKMDRLILTLEAYCKDEIKKMTSYVLPDSYWMFNKWEVLL